MRDSPDHSQLTEVLVESDKNPTFGMSGCEDFLIARILIPIARPDDIVAAHPECVGSSTPYAGVKEKSHIVLSIVSGSIRSWPTCRRA